jgi:hypothetical protein
MQGRVRHYAATPRPHFSISGAFSTSTRAAGKFHEHLTTPHNFAPPCNESRTFSVARVGA